MIENSNQNENTLAALAPEKPKEPVSVGNQLAIIAAAGAITLSTISMGLRLGVSKFNKSGKTLKGIFKEHGTHELLFGGFIGALLGFMSGVRQQKAYEQELENYELAKENATIKQNVMSALEGSSINTLAPEQFKKSGNHTNKLLEQTEQTTQAEASR